VAYYRRDTWHKYFFKKIKNSKKIQKNSKNSKKRGVNTWYLLTVLVLY